MSKKTPSKKSKLRKARRRMKPVPVFVRLKTKRRVLFSPKRRHWRRGKIKKK